MLGAVADRQDSVIPRGGLLPLRGKVSPGELGILFATSPSLQQGPEALWFPQNSPPPKSRGGSP